jgi:homospermidine synthase
MIMKSWPNCFKILKNVKEVKNYEICQDAMISYMKVVVKIWEGFEHDVNYDV